MRFLLHPREMSPTVVANFKLLLVCRARGPARPQSGGIFQIFIRMHCTMPTRQIQESREQLPTGPFDYTTSAPKYKNICSCFLAVPCSQKSRLPLSGEAAQAVKKPLWVVWRAVALQMQSESGDMCGGFASLRSKVSLRRFPPGSPMGGREKNGVNLGKGRRRRTFSTR